jgi:hypothetical protein
LRLLVISSDNLLDQIKEIASRDGHDLTVAMNFEEAKNFANDNQFDRIIFKIDLNNSESYDFLGFVKSLSYHHADIVETPKDYLASSRKENSELIKSIQHEDNQKKIDILMQANLSSPNALETSYLGKFDLKLLSVDDLDIHTTYIFDYSEQSIYLGTKQEIDFSKIKKIKIQLTLDQQILNLELTGHIKALEKFDTNQDKIHYLEFIVDHKSSALWQKNLEKIQERKLLLDDLVENLRGF